MPSFATLTPVDQPLTVDFLPRQLLLTYHWLFWALTFWMLTFWSNRWLPELTLAVVDFCVDFLGWLLIVRVDFDRVDFLQPRCFLLSFSS